MINDSLKTGTKFIVSFAVFSILMAIPLLLRDQLKYEYPVYYWANSGNIFTDWGIYYLDFIPAWFVISLLWVTGSITPFRIAKWFVVFFLGFWLFYDWFWWGAVIAVDPASFSWTAPFYFDILVPGTPMWVFLLASIAGAVLALYVARTSTNWTNLVPFIMYLVFIYGLGGITQVVAMDIMFYWFWDLVFIVALIVAIPLARRTRSIAPELRVESMYVRRVDRE